MLPGVDYVVDWIIPIAPGREEVVLLLLGNPVTNPQLFWRLVFSQTAP